MIPPAPTLFADPGVAAEVSRAPALALLVGGYDGSGNYGDIAQLDAALGLLQDLEPGLLLLPVLERSFLAGHRELPEAFMHRFPRAAFFDPGEGHEDELLPLPSPTDLAFGCCYLYGGGYLNQDWGERKLAMLRAAEALLSAGGAPAVCRVSSGLQVDPGWIADLGQADADALRSFELLGARDPRSGEALAALESNARVLATGDDAIGALRRVPPIDAEPAIDRRLRVNVHVAQHAWVTGRPEAVLEFYGEFIAELGRRAELPVEVRPLLAYVDRRIDEREGLNRLAALCADRGVELAEPCLLRPASLGEALPDLSRGAVTISCSYHVALTSLQCGVPAALIGDNPYYEQKAAGLLDDFGLPGAFAPALAANPVESAREVAGSLLGDAGDALRGRLMARAQRAHERRAAVEADLLARLGGAATAAMATRIRELGERLRERSTEPTELLARISQLESESSGPAATERDPAGDGQAADAVAQEALKTIMNSRSWRLTAPLRRAGALLRRRS